MKTIFLANKKKMKKIPHGIFWLSFMTLLLLLGPQGVAGQEDGQDESSSNADVYDMDASNNNRPTNQNRVEITNPFFSGCFQQRKPDWTKKRTCSVREASLLRQLHNEHGNDSPLCDPPAFEEYMEIRIAAGNWDSATALSWLLQIVLSEVVGVPVSIETASPDSSRDFYDPNGARIDNDSGVSPTKALTKATQVRDCLVARYNPRKHTEEDYTPCAHFVTEAWGINDELIGDELVEPPQALGVLGTEAWFVTKFTADAHPELVSYHGLSKPENRELLAELFQRPTTWGDYCSQVSTTNCTTPDETAQRPPANEVESNRMFAQGVYTGHFRPTAANNCTDFPDNCTGHFANYPCGWQSNTETNLHYLGIALDSKNGPNGEPNGYTTDQLVEMWDAANATKSNLMMMWWKPEPLFLKYFGTEAEMQQVYLKPYSMECDEARSYLKKECAPDLETRIGKPEEACENPTEPLRKLINFNLYDTTHDPDIPEEAVSPAYDILKRFFVSDIQLEMLFDYLERPNMTKREAVCQYAVDNYKDLYANVPDSYPRVTQEVSQTALDIVSVVVAGFATCIVGLTALLVYLNRNRLAIRLAQIDFLSLLLAGSFVICIGAMLSSVSTRDSTCVASVWFIYVGYSLELVPLMIKVSALNRMVASAKRFRRVTLNRQSLYRAVGLITAIIVVLLVVWTVLDPPRTQPEYSLTSKYTTEGTLEQRVVDKTFYCSSEATAWQFAAEGWNTVLLLCASVLAYQSRNLIQHFNESRTLGFMIYSHLIFVLFRMTTLMLEDNNTAKVDTLEWLRNLSYAVDQVATCFIYFLPKLTAHLRGEDNLSSDTLSNINMTAFTPSKINGRSGSMDLVLPGVAGGSSDDGIPSSSLRTGRRNIRHEPPESPVDDKDFADDADDFVPAKSMEVKVSEALSSQTEVVRNTAVSLNEQELPPQEEEKEEDNAEEITNSACDVGVMDEGCQVHEQVSVKDEDDVV